MSPEQRNALEEDLEAWQKVQVKIAVLGATGVGKSTFINRIRGLTVRDKVVKTSHTLHSVLFIRTFSKIQPRCS